MAIGHPQANSIVKQVHQMNGNILRTIDFYNTDTYKDVPIEEGLLSQLICIYIYAFNLIKSSQNVLNLADSLFCTTSPMKRYL